MTELQGRCIQFWWDQRRHQYVVQWGEEWRYIIEGALCFDPFDKTRVWQTGVMPEGLVRDTERWQV